MFDSDCFDIRVMGEYIGSDFLSNLNQALIIFNGVNIHAS
jgi:hypothetical protein